MNRLLIDKHPLAAGQLAKSVNGYLTESHVTKVGPRVNN
jgi:hypothetical protein